MQGIHIGKIAEASNFWDSNLIATLTGAVIAWAVTYIGVELSKRAANKVTAQLIIVRIGIIAANLKAMKKSLDEDFASQAPENQYEPWRFVKPSVNETDKIRFSDVENALCLEVAGFEGVGDLIQLQSTHNGYIDMTRMFAIQKMEIKSKLPANTILTGGFKMSEAERIALVPYTADMNSLIDIMRKDLGSDFDKTIAVLTKLKKIFNKKVGVKFPKPAKAV